MPTARSDEGKKAASLEFSKLESLRRYCAEMQQYQLASLKYFKFSVGFRHVLGKEDKISVSSSATCVLSLTATGNWKQTKSDTKALLKQLIPKRTSAGLPEDNPFTAAWILEAVTSLEGHSEALEQSDLELIAKKEAILQQEVKNGNGAVSMSQYPGSAYLTQLVVRVLRSRKKLTPELERLVSDWAWRELTRQLALVQSKDKTQDAFAFAYLLMLVTSVTPLAQMSPERTSLQRAALQTVFECQLKDGTWPMSRPLFHYPNVGNAHCYEYEMLTQLLQEPELEDLLLENLERLSLAAESLAHTAYRFEPGVRAWASGHHPQLPGPESWTTASVYHFIYKLDRLLAEAVRRQLFRHIDQPLPRTVKRNNKKKEDFAPTPSFLDSVLNVHGKQPQSLRDFLWDNFVQPLSAEADRITEGRRFERGTPRSAIFFGPPGTSKTELSKKVADFLGWPLLAVDPSILLRKGMEGIQAEANILFRMLEQTEGIVVLLDEFDEFVRERGSSDAEQFSRLLTTAMLPKLATIHKRATLVFIIATNNIQQFDLAIRRPGRFDRVVQIMPPTYDQKLLKKDWGSSEDVDIGEKLRTLNVNVSEEIKKRLGQLTYGECDGFATELGTAESAKGAVKILDEHWNRCILRTRVSQDSKTTWEERCKTESQFNT